MTWPSDDDSGPMIRAELREAELQREIASLRAALAAEQAAHEATKLATEAIVRGANALRAEHVEALALAAAAHEECARLPAIVERAEQAEADLAVARAEVARLEAIEMPADVEQAYERGWMQRAAATRRAESERDALRAEVERLRAVRDADEDGLCSRCIDAGHRALEVLAAIGMAVATQSAIAQALYSKDQDWFGDPETSANAWALYEEALAALCGVDVATVRRWGR